MDAKQAREALEACAGRTAPDTFLIDKQYDGGLLLRTKNHVEAGGDIGGLEGASEFLLRTCLHTASSHGRFVNAMVRLSAVTLAADRHLDEPVVRASLRLGASALRGTIEACAVTNRDMKRLNIPLTRFHKRQKQLVWKDTIELGTKIADTTCCFSTRGRIDIIGLHRTGELRLAAKREGFVEPTDVKKIAEAVGNLAELDFEAEVRYCLLSELLHPAVASSIDHLGRAEVVEHHGLAFRRLSHHCGEGPPENQTHPRVLEVLDSMREDVLRLAARIVKDGERIEGLLRDFAEFYARSLIGFLNSENPALSKILRDRLERAPYGRCLCLSDKKFKFCCRPSF